MNNVKKLHNWKRKASLKGGNAVCIDRADVSDKATVRRWRRFPVWGEGRFGDHTLLVKAPPQIPTHMSVTMRRERGPPRLAPWNH